MSMLRKMLLILCSVMIVFAIIGCKKQGPAENAGKKIDNAIEKADQKIDKAAEKTGDKLEDAGDKVKDATKK